MMPIRGSSFIYREIVVGIRPSYEGIEISQPPEKGVEGKGAGRIITVLSMWVLLLVDTPASVWVCRVKIDTILGVVAR